MDYTEILYAVEQRVARLTLNRPEKRNALSLATVSELCHALERAKGDDEVRVVVLTGAGKLFSAGGDLGQMSAGGGTAAAVPPRSYVDLNLVLAELGKPTIAMVNGHALAGGLGLVVGCDLALAAESACFGTPEINVGLWPMMVMANLLRTVGRKAALRLLLTGEKISAGEAVRIGLINEAVADDGLEAHTMALAQALAAKSPAVMRLGLHALRAADEKPFEEALRYLEGQLGAVLSTEDAREGLSAFLQKRAPVFTGR
ncbi:MAG: enoyl-CoA hydratase/isomerase family protein [Deltaproteobacteria bacterium]|nr:enoyl-CoA hydratase/isomerase family protein [Deltaproteobacteria bacterium]